MQPDQNATTRNQLSMSHVCECPMWRETDDNGACDALLMLKIVLFHISTKLQIHIIILVFFLAVFF